MRVATYNIHHGAGADWRVDLERTAATLRSQRPDLAGLQEVDRNFGPRTRWTDQSLLLGEAVGMHSGFAPAIERRPARRGGQPRQYGNAVLSRTPLGSVEAVPLPTTRWSEERVLMRASTVTESGAAVDFWVVHLEHIDPVLRRRQAAAVAERVGGARRTVLVGDMNAEPDAHEIRLLTGNLVDAWAAVGRDPGVTVRGGVRGGRRIDYVLMSPDLRPVAATVVDSDASDHLALVVDLAVPAGE